MYNGLADSEQHDEGDDERSGDEISECPQEFYPEGSEKSDPEQSASEAASNVEVTDNNSPEEAENLEETEHNSSDDAVGNFLRLLPYLYLVQRTLDPGCSQIIPNLEEDADEARLDQNTDSQKIRSLLQLDALKSQFQTGGLKYAFNSLQHLMPIASNPLNGFHGTNNLTGTCFGNNSFERNETVNADEPLDLTKRNKYSTGNGDLKPRDEKLLRLNSRTERGYTVQDLDAALNDIKSGKLGTRRAAVIYGIPRSTLRNKVYKMGKAQMKSPEHNHFSRVLSNDRNGGDAADESRGNTRKESHKKDVEMNGSSAVNRSFQEKSLNRHGHNLYSCLQGDNSSSNEAPGRETSPPSDLTEDRSKLSFTAIGKDNHCRDVDERGRHGPDISLPMVNYPSAQLPSTSYDGIYMESYNSKKSRPKRGKYRNYDRDALAKAVQAVQNGEMSVHRAGSFFGVPHSTLEYKVKERHLLRQSKSKGKSVTKSGTKLIQSLPAAGSSSVTSLSPTALADSNDSFHFQRSSIPDLQRSLSSFFTSSARNFPGSSWNTPLLHASGLRDKEREDEQGFESLTMTKSKIFDSSPPRLFGKNYENSSNDLLDLTKKT